MQRKAEDDIPAEGGAAEAPHVRCIPVFDLASERATP
jgi:hypothetical protein